MRYKVVFWPLLNQTMAIVTIIKEGDHQSWSTHHQYDLKTGGDALWPLEDLLRELADQVNASQF